MIAYKIMTAAELERMRRDGEFSGSAVDVADGFIHLSGADQVAETAERHFRGQTDLALVAVDLDVLGNAVKWEPSRGGQLFPHVYGVLPMHAVVSAGPLTPAR